MITLDGPTREFRALPAWRDPVEAVTCPRCADGRAVLSAMEAELVIELAGGRTGDWQAARCSVRPGWHMGRRTHHERRDSTGGFTWKSVLLAALLAAAALALPLLDRF
ncbi:hypothetical protein R8Z50_29830 [Longispora sp. K20-0274]|uniref:hypothetical protein n=1 Tax=Longispora sp. K20-0274 TaxID=3088255 RepID=UPI0039999C3C